ncbi:nucleoside-diphosphate-sugar epimerase [Raoultella sp. BIGb0138]|uniref:D-erythronate dehydrogenase n=1 Tax=Raoultella sp. BIGb0138 TaxID=2485115 RepID=UPI0010510360|nr:D-erythronate dehydrogenase [Raoultella sp. BIGb0138]TCW08552.1 nucleoside-diphosphate-sugar epimerase [Raoultella sp. BIGb0138]
MNKKLTIVVTGAAGFLGSLLVKALLQRETLADNHGIQREIGRLIAFDRCALEGIDDSRLEVVTGDISDSSRLKSVLPAAVDSVFHLAAIVSGQAEQEFDTGMQINVDAFRQLLEQLRQLNRPVKLVTTSSVAVFGGNLPAKVSDREVWMPQSSYGTQKAICDLLLADYTRRGWVNGRSLRMPTIVVRPGRPNKAASSFASGIIREPINGEHAICPVTRDTLLWLLSPRKAIEALIHGHDIEDSRFTAGRVINLAGLSVTVEQMVTALAQVVGPDAGKHIEFAPDATIERIVNSWPGDFDTRYAHELGFTANEDFTGMIEEYLADYAS